MATFPTSRTKTVSAGLPRYNSSEQLNTQPNAVVRQGAGDTADIIGQTAGQVSDITTKWSQAMDTIQSTTVKANIKTALPDIEQRALADPEYNNIDKYYQELDSLKKNNIKGFQSKANEQQTALDVDLDLQLAKLRIDNVYKKKALDVGRASTLKLLDLEQSNYINAQTEEEKLTATSNMKNIMLDKQKAYLFGYEEGDKLVNKLIEEAQDAIKDRESLKRVKEKEFRLANETAVNDNEKNYIKMKVTGVDKLGTPISRDEMINLVRKDLDNKTVSPEFADRYINALKSPKAVGAKTVDKDFADMMSDISKGIKTPERIRKNMLELVSDGYLSEKDFQAVSTYFDLLSDKHPDDLVANSIRKGWFGIETITENTTAKEESRSRMSRSYIANITGGTDPQVSAQEAIRTEVLYLHPEVVNYPNGMQVIDSKGRRKIIKQNGEVIDNTLPKKEAGKKE